MKNVENDSGLLSLGSTLQMGKYRVDGYLSSGGFGNTYVVTNVQFDERYAMKEFFMKGINERAADATTVKVSNPANREQFASQREKFKKEARRLRKLHNGHIVQVHDMFEENDTSYYVMDLIDGESLSNRLKRTGRPFSEGVVRGILSQVLDGLDEVHSQGIYHLDLKPANIMLDKTGKATLIDFGACKQLGSNEGQTSTSSSFCYSAGYAPTEQIDQKMERIGPWTDLYALGATLYNLLTNCPPLSSSEIQDGEHPEYPVPVSDDMQSLISWMMQPNRKNRPQTVDEIRNKGYADSEYNSDFNGDEQTIVGKSLIAPHVDSSLSSNRKRDESLKSKFKDLIKTFFRDCRKRNLITNIVLYGLLIFTLWCSILYLLNGVLNGRPFQANLMLMLLFIAVCDVLVISWNRIGFPLGVIGGSIGYVFFYGVAYYTTDIQTMNSPLYRYFYPDPSAYELFLYEIPFAMLIGIPTYWFALNLPKNRISTWSLCKPAPKIVNVIAFVSILFAISFVFYCETKEPSYYVFR